MPVLRRIRRALFGEGGSLLGEPPLAAADLTRVMQQSSRPYGGFYALLVFATLIATCGLLANSAATIIGAMIIAPLMSPIMSFAFAIVIIDRNLLIRSLFTVVTGACLVIGVAFLVAELVGLRIAGSEILNRTQPTLLDLGVALAAGAAGAFAYVRPGVATAIAGVAIAVALAPPLAVVGIGLAIGNETSIDVLKVTFANVTEASGAYDVAIGAFILFFTNLAGIAIAAALIFVASGYGQWKKALAGILVTGVVASFLIHPLDVSLRQIYLRSLFLIQIGELMASDPDLYSGKARLQSLDISYLDEALFVDIDMLAPKDEMERAEERIDVLYQHLIEQHGQVFELRVDIIPVEFATIEKKPSADLSTR
ncbi:MAG: DUF389 domain-containing protein [Geminicoccaceae bacterium]